MKKYFFGLFMILALVGLFPIGVLQGSAQASGLSTIISSDTVWTKANSPYNLTSSVLVDGVTLTIEPGVVVNLNDFEILVHGTLRAIGTVNEKITFDHGKIKFSPYSNPWNPQTNSGNVFDNCVLNFSWILSNVSLRLTNSDLSMMYLADSSLISNSVLLSPIEVGSFNNISDNYCWHSITAENSNMICDNNISKLYTGDSNIIYNNIIRIETAVGQSNSFYNNTITGEVSLGHSSEFLNNTVNGVVEATASVISNNIFYHPGNIRSAPDFRGGMYVGFEYDTAIEVSGNCEISDNIIVGPGRDLVTGSGYGIKVDDDYSYIFNNIIFDYDVAINAQDGTTIQGNLLTNNSEAIVIDHGSVVVRNNTITNGERGVVAYGAGSVTIDLNLISNQTVCGVYVECQNTIRNNTIANTPIALKLVTSPLGAIHYNNFENYTEYSVYFETNSNNFDFSHNWWGTTDNQAINLTIHDFKYDFNSEKVDFTPFLTEPNQKALPHSTPELPSNYSIPEFPSWLLLPLFLVITSAVVFFRKNFGGRFR